MNCTKNFKTAVFNYGLFYDVISESYWSLTLREERKLRVFENMVLRRIFGPRREEVKGNGEDCKTRS